MKNSFRLKKLRAGQEAYRAGQQRTGKERFFRAVRIGGRNAAAAALAAAVLASVLVLGVAGMLLASPLGILFSGEENGAEFTVKEAVRRLNIEFQTRLEEEEQCSDAEKKEVMGSRAPWREILALYAVECTTDMEHAADVVSMDGEKYALLRRIFWDMNTISSREEIRQETEEREIRLKGGKTIRETVLTDRTCLIVTVDHRSAEETAGYYSFSESQRAMLSELLSEELRPMWTSLLYGTGADGTLADVALTQVGQIGGQPYWEWYGYTQRVEWCACFVSWCANECGYVEQGVFPKFDNCQVGVEWFRKNAGFAGREETPDRGWIIFFDWENDGVSDHVGIVEKCEGGYVHTVEGNSGDVCRQGAYPAGSQQICGYGVMDTSADGD